MFLPANNRRLDKEGRWQPVRSPEPEATPVVEEPKPKEPEIPRAKVGLVMRLKITLDFRLWRRLKAAGMWTTYFDMWLPKSRIMNGDCPANCGASSQRYYGHNPNVIMKCLSCGAEQAIPMIHNWHPRD